MNMKTLTTLLAFSGTVVCLGATPGFADAGHCRHVGGGVLTNFLDQTHTEGASTGDIRGAIGVAVIGQPTSGPNGTTIYHVQHHWVTDSGDTIFLNDAFLTTFPTSDPNRVLGDYLKGVDLIGGTGSFDDAKGTLSFFGADDLKLGQIALRYEGTVCFKPAAGL
jgi:hypothetical protein